MTDVHALEDENKALKRELQELQNRQRGEKQEYEAKFAKEKHALRVLSDTFQAKEIELETLRSSMAKLTKQLDAEMTRKDAVEARSQLLERQLQGLSGEPGTTDAKNDSRPRDRRVKNEAVKGDEKDVSIDQVSTKIMRVVQQYIESKDCQQAFLRNSGINDVSFHTLVQVLRDCRSLQLIDLSRNSLTMDSCSDLCKLITTCAALTVISVAENRLPLRCIGYFMTAVMERQTRKKLLPLESLDLEGNDGFVAAANAAPIDSIMKQGYKTFFLSRVRPPQRGAVLSAHVTKALWTFLHFTKHPQVENTDEQEVSFQALDKATIRKMENALAKIHLMSEDKDADGKALGKALHANLAISSLFDKQELEDASPETDALAEVPTEDLQPGSDGQESLSPQLGEGRSRTERAYIRQATSDLEKDATAKPGRMDLRDPFGDLKKSYDPAKEKLKTFNLKQIVTRNGTVLMNMLERLLEFTDIDAQDVESEQTLLEYACCTGNMGLAKLCYRRGANLSARTKKGESYFNIVTKSKRYDLMEFLHTYGVKVNHQDAEGRTALHIAAGSDDVDAICRLLEWGADVNLHDFKRRTPLHTAARSGHMKATMLLLEVGADLNAKDEKEYTAVAHAEANNHFVLMDRLVQLGGKGHGLSTQGNSMVDSRYAKSLGELTIAASTLKTSALGRLGKVAVKGLPGPLSPSLVR